MKKKLVALVVACSMVLGLAACGGSSSSSSSSESKPAAETAEAGDASGSGDAAASTEAPSGWAPSGTVSIIVPAGAGGNTDLSARVFAQYAKEISGVDFIVVNANGAAGSVAANQVLSAAPDGQTVLYGHNLVNVAKVAGVTDYDYTAFKLGPTFAKDPAQQLYVNPKKYADMNAFLEAAKANPGGLKACTEVGAYTYYELLAFENLAGIDLDLVDVGSNSDKITAMLSEQVDLMPGAYINCKDYLESGQFACIGAPTAERYELIADIPTLKEQGIDLVYPDCDFSFYFPKETSDDVIAWYEWIVQEMESKDECLEAIKNVEMMPYYLSAADSEANDKAYLETFQSVADSVAK